MAGFDKWLLLKIFEFFFVLACLVCKKVTDDEESRLFLYLQKLSREWPFLNSVTWDTIGSAVADAVYGGFLIITAGMVLGRALNELPSRKRVMERFFLGTGAILFIVLGGLELASLDSVPPDLIDNAAVLGTLSIITGLLFFMDLAAPQLKNSPKQTQTSPHLQLKPLDINPEAYIINGNKKRETIINGNHNGIKNGKEKQSVLNNDNKTKDRTKPKHFDIYGNDKHDKDENDSVVEMPVEMAKHSPVFSRMHRPLYGQYDNLSPTYLRFPMELEAVPNSPGEPGYVQYTAKRWGQQSQKTPKNSPTDV